MMKHSLCLIVAGALVLGVGTSVAEAQAPKVPPTLKVPAGHTLFFEGHAVGTQNFICLPTSSGGAAWRFVAPQATLFETSTGVPQQVTTHFLSVNPDEPGTARPTWQHSVDTSRVWARALASSTDPDFVEPGAIPWLLLEVVGAEAGPAGGSLLTDAVYIHRLNTTGGVTPTTGCTQVSEIGSLALVPYTADYFFYRVRRR